MEANSENTALAIVVPSLKKNIDSLDSELAKELAEKQHRIAEAVSIKIEGNSYSKEFCQSFGELLSKAENLKDLNINDIFVARSKAEVPQSILSISKGLANSRLQRLDISNNAVNVYGAENLLHFLSKASFLEVLLISNCGLGPLGVAHIAEGLKGTPQLKVFSIGRNRMEDPGILSLAGSMKYVPKLEELFVYQNTLKEGGLRELFKNLRENCHNLSSLDVNDNFIRKTATTELALLLKHNLALRNINLSDCLVNKENEEVVAAFEVSENRQWERIGYNYAELDEELALRLLEVLSKCPLKKLDIIGNEFEEELQEAYSKALPSTVDAKYEEEEDAEDVIRLFEQLKI